MELAELLGKLAPIPPDGETLAQFRALAARGRALVDRPDPRVFARLNMDFFKALTGITGNEPLRDISERLYYQTARIWLKLIAELDLAEEAAIFAREIAERIARSLYRRVSTCESSAPRFTSAIWSASS